MELSWRTALWNILRENTFQEQILDVIQEHFSWTCFRNTILDMFQEHISWTSSKNIFPGHASGTYFLDILQEDFSWTSSKKIFPGDVAGTLSAWILTGNKNTNCGGRPMMAFQRTGSKNCVNNGHTHPSHTPHWWRFISIFYTIMLSDQFTSRNSPPPPCISEHSIYKILPL